MTTKRVSAFVTLLLLANAPLHSTAQKKMFALLALTGYCAVLAHTRMPTNHVKLTMLPLDSSTFFEIEVIDGNRELFFGTNRTHGCTINQNNSCTNHHGGKDCIYTLNLEGEKPVIAELCEWSFDQK